mgnify:CR=1 FL=1|tara:strand:+ start:3851 stop:5296 length:1446 start_codon:yes stop_codon:yes gene_type:complete
MIAQPLDTLGLLLALCLPWLAGATLVHALLLPTGRYNWPVVLGHGFFIGLLLATSLLRLWDALEFGFHFMSMALVLVALAVAGGLLMWVQRARDLVVVQRLSPADRPVNGWQIALIVLLLALLFGRYAGLLEELLLRPLYAWDAWMNWAPKAIVWFHHGALVEYVSPEQWQEQSGAALYTLGNKQAWDYPVMVPLIQLWSMLGIGTWDHNAVYLPWLLAPLCLALAIFGHLRLAGVSLPLAVSCCYLLLSMPYVNVHSVLAGYADIWQAAAFGLGVCALYEWRRYRHWAYGLLYLLMALLCVQFKVPGMVLALILLAGGVRTLLNLAWQTEVLLFLVAGTGLVIAAFVGVSFTLPYLGNFALMGGYMELGGLGDFEIAYHPVAETLVESFAWMINWHLLGYLLPAFLFYCGLRRRLLQPVATEVLVVMVALAFVAGVFLFTGYYTQALNFVALNRAVLYPVPALLFVCFLHFPVASVPADR